MAWVDAANKSWVPVEKMECIVDRFPNFRGFQRFEKGDCVATVYTDPSVFA